MIKLDVRTNFPEFLSKIDKTRADQLPQAMAWTLTEVAKRGRDAVIAEMQRVFDRPTPYTLNSLYVWGATKKKLVAEVVIKDDQNKGTPASKYLAPEIEGGERSFKRFERSLQLAGLLPSGMYAAPGHEAPLDQYGNMPPQLLVRILSDLRAFPEAGYRANRRLSKASTFFVARAGSHLKPGIYWRLPNRMLVCIVAFVRTPHYSVRLAFYPLLQRTAAAEFPRVFPLMWQRALSTDRGAR
ncbi:MAG TPA: hypothetical protein VFB13_17800 [Reyranella sp.]|nr:hypothetical protein [Reyranella sp.]